MAEVKDQKSEVTRQRSEAGDVRKGEEGGRVVIISSDPVTPNVDPDVAS
jgi:hypothetical protein